MNRPPASLRWLVGVLALVILPGCDVTVERLVSAPPRKNCRAVISWSPISERTSYDEVAIVTLPVTVDAADLKKPGIRDEIIARACEAGGDVLLPVTGDHELARGGVQSFVVLRRIDSVHSNP